MQLLGSFVILCIIRSVKEKWYSKIYWYLIRFYSVPGALVLVSGLLQWFRLFYLVLLQFSNSCSGPEVALCLPLLLMGIYLVIVLVGPFSYWSCEYS